MNSCSSEENESVTSERIEHLVVFKFKPSTTEEQKQEVISRFMNLKNSPAAQSLPTLSYYQLIYLSNEEGLNTSTFGISNNSTSTIPVPLT